VGVIPDDWDLKRCSALSNMITVGIVVRPTRYYDSQGVPALRSANIRERGITDADLVFITDAANALLCKSQVRIGDVLTVRTGYPGTSAVVPPRFHGANCIDVLITRPNKSTSPKFLAAWINSSFGKTQVLRNQGGLAQQHFNVADLRNLVVAVPKTKAEQEAIAEALSDADALIESLEQLIAKKRQIKQGAMQELLTGKKRLPGFRGKWETKRIDELADIRSGGTPSTVQPLYWDGDIPWCTPTDITQLDGCKYISGTRRTISAEGLRSSSAEIIPASSIVMTSRATIGECAINLGSLATNQGFKNFIPLEGVDVEFLYYLLLMQKQGFLNLCSGSTFLEIGKAQLASFLVILPEVKAEQTAIATILSDMDAELTALEAKLAKARGIKQGMMQELLTGRIRLL
jgi:type I restriction enzyme, S subunit